MKQQIVDAGPTGLVRPEARVEEGLYTLLALVGARSMGLDALQERTRLSYSAFHSLLGWLQKEHLVDLVSTLDGDGVKESVGLTEKGEALLISLLERTCELPELR